MYKDLTASPLQLDASLIMTVDHGIASAWHGDRQVGIVLSCTDTVLIWLSSSVKIS